MTAVLLSSEPRGCLCFWIRYRSNKWETELMRLFAFYTFNQCRLHRAATGGASNVNQREKDSDDSQSKGGDIYLTSGGKEQLQPNEQEQLNV